MNEAPTVSKRVLVVDDERQIGDVLSAYLQREGYIPVVAETLAGAVSEIERQLPDLLLLDVTLPDGSGLDLLRSLNEQAIPTIMLTARGDEVDRVVGLEMGADDYITKPFSPREVIARVRAVLRRSEERDRPGGRHRLHVLDLAIDGDAHEVRRNNEKIDLTPSEFRILSALARHPGQVFSRVQLLDAIGDDGSIYERTLDRHINNLRRKIEIDPLHPRYVLTVFGVGYKAAHE